MSNLPTLPEPYMVTTLRDLNHTKFPLWEEKQLRAYARQYAAQVEAERDALREDAERFRALRWFWEDERDMAPGGRWWTAVMVKMGKPTIADAIDAARKAEA